MGAIVFERRKIFLILGLISFLVYFNSLGNSFIADDVSAIVNNPLILKPLRFWLEPSGFLKSLNYLIGGYNPFVYHLTNIFLHFTVAILVFLLLSLFFKINTAFLSACLFAVYPINTESVTWISGRPYIITALFILGTYLLYHRATPSVSSGSPISRPDGTAVVKEAAAFRPFYYILSLIVFSYFTIQHTLFSLLLPFFMASSDVALKRWRKNIKWWIPYLLITSLNLIASRSEISNRSAFMTVDMGFSIVKNPLTYFVYSLYSHFWLLVWPVRLTLFHEPIVIPQSMLDFRVLLYALPVIPLLIIIFKRAKKLFYCISIFILFLAPTYSPIPVSSLVAERYLYFPSIALSAAIAFLYETYSDRKARFKKYFLFLFLLLIIASALRTIIRNMDWDNPRAFWQQVLSVSPNSWNAHDSLGFIYLSEGDPMRAVEELKQVIAMKRGSVTTYNNLGVAYTMLGNNKGEAIACFNKVLEIDPEYINAYYNLGRVYMGINKDKEAEGAFKKALKINPYFSSAHFYLCVVYFNQKEYNLAADQCYEATGLGYKVPAELLELLKPYRKIH
mgnify:CR=1 FL=1